MPIYFNDIAPICPISQDEPVGPMAAPIIRTTIPHAFDLPSALAAVNIARTILQQIIVGRTINNTVDISVPGAVGRSGGGQPKPAKTISKLQASRWKQLSKQTGKYKYYAKDANGNDDTDVWLITERIESIVWYDSGWKTYLTFNYGDKGEGEQQ